MSKEHPRITGPTLKVLGALMTADELSGADIGRVSGLSSGTLYPILFRLEWAEWLASRWENGDPKALGRPRRRYYRVTEVGRQKARAAVRELEPAFGKLSWA